MHCLHCGSGGRNLIETRFLIAQFGKPSERKKARSVIVETDELPGNGWKLLSERLWRSGVIGAKSSDPVAQRSRQAGGFAAWRSFGLEYPPRGLWAEVIPYGTIADAEAAVPNMRSMVKKNPHFDGWVAGERTVEGIASTGATRLMVSEQFIEGTAVGPRNTKYFIGCVGPIVFLLVGTAPGDVRGPLLMVQRH